MDLEAMNRAIAEALRYYLGPTGIPERLGALAEANPVVSMERSMVASREMAAPNKQPMERVGKLGEMLSNMAGVVAPTMVAGRAGLPAAQAISEGLTGLSSSPAAAIGRNFIEDESGALTLYHGSPYDFDRFSMDKIGTGEGAQAYGHGLYFAESPDVAEMYRRKLAFPAGGGDDILAKIADDVNYYSGNVDAARAAYEAGLKSSNPEMVKLARAKLDALPAAQAKYTGRMYEVRVDANPEDFLDWDRPLSEQPKKVRDVLRSFGAKPDDVGAGAYSRAGVRKFVVMGPDGRFGPGAATREESLALVGGDATKVRGILDPSAPNRSAGLLQEGIPGIRYLDAGSRGAGDGSRNYVVFDENLISIIRKYGIAGAAAMLGMSQADLAQAMEQQGSAADQPPRLKMLGGGR